MDDSPDLARRVARATRNWPLTELDPIERSAFADAVAHARSFEDLDPPWQELILRAETGPPRRWRDFHLCLRGRKTRQP